MEFSKISSVLEMEDTKVSFNLNAQIQTYNTTELVVIEASKFEGKQGKRKRRTIGVVAVQSDCVARNHQSWSRRAKDLKSRSMASSSVASMSSQPSSIPLFEWENYDFWCIKMKTLFINQDVWDLIENGFDELENVITLTSVEKNQLKELNKMNAKALLFIQ